MNYDKLKKRGLISTREAYELKHGLKAKPSRQSAASSNERLGDQHQHPLIPVDISFSDIIELYQIE